MNFFRTLLVLPFFATSAVAADDSLVAVQEAVLANIVENTSVAATPIQDESLAKVFAPDFYVVEIRFKEGNSTSINRATYAGTADGMQQVTEPGTNADMPGLLKLVDPSFRLVSEQDGEVMMEAFTAAFGLEFDDVAPRVIREGNQWSFITDDFFDKFSGFVVETDDDGKIMAIRRSLEISG